MHLRADQRSVYWEKASEQPSRVLLREIQEETCLQRNDLELSIRELRVKYVGPASR